MRTRRRATIEDLRLAIDCLPRRTRIAMLEGIAGNEIIAGAYANRDGVCPMLAAHRAGGRTSVIAFAKAWDRFAFRDTGSQRARRARRATERELLTLKAHLEASLLAEDAPTGDLAAARREHLALLARREREHAKAVPSPRPASPTRAETEPSRRSAPSVRPGDADRSSELGNRPGWAWTRVVRRYDEYERVLARLESERLAAQSSERQPALTASPRDAGR
jgi:hypothetical protein